MLINSGGQSVANSDKESKMAKRELRIVHGEQSNDDTMKMFLWGDGFLAHVWRDGVDTGKTTVLYIARVLPSVDGTRNVTFLTNHGRLGGVWPNLESIDD